MTTEGTTTRSNPLLTTLGFLLPIGSLVGLLGGGILLLLQGPSVIEWSERIVGIGVMLSLAYIALTIIRVRSRPGARTALSLVSGAGLILLGGFVMLTVLGVSALSAALAPDLRMTLASQALEASVPVEAFLADGPQSGALGGADWRDRTGDGEVPIEVKWTREARGVLVTASPSGPVPEGQDGTPQTQLFLEPDTLAFPRDFYAIEAKKPFISSVGSWLEMFNQAIEATASPIVAAAAENDGRLPAADRAAELLDEARKVYTVVPEGTGTPQSDQQITFVFTGYTYAEEEKDRFGIRYAWSCDTNLPSSPGFDSVEGPVTGAFTIEFTASGMMILKRVDGRLQHPLNMIAWLELRSMTRGAPADEPASAE